ncbi:MAG: HAMP domain-containing histidine kinase [Bacteroidetes bacterium]|nr:HAMP domain-containing histidine kinase [Bacteroidota bacterium]MBU1113760.1 HAMP domain-containing histidine kinase [Bacteroidota bacterium]MBU1800490.1 HAMP domain-containing histidine kinase [Bacteroidota bacterium]
MKENKIKILIVVMALAVVGLISLQIFWSVKTINTEEIRFDATINNVLADAVRSIEKNRTANILLKKVGEGTNTIIWVDSTSNNGDSNKIMFFGSNSNATIQQKVEGDLINLDIEISTDTVDLKTGKNKERVFKRIVKFDKDSQPTKLDTVAKVDTFSFNKSNLVKEVLEEMLSFEKEKYFSENIELEVIDSAISMELKNKGIKTIFNFGIYDNKENKFLSINKNADEAKLINSKYKTSLSPNDIFSKSIMLVVEIPNRFPLILKSIWITFALSLTFISVIIWVFVKTVKMFYEQKKVTELKNDLINNITHEFKTPIASIALASEALEEPKLLEQKNSVQRYSKIINEENKKLNTLVENLLNSAAFEKSDIKLKKERVNIIEIINDTISQFEERNKEVKISINIVSKDYSFVSVDKFHFANVVTNLFDNAYKYSSDSKEIIVDVISNKNGIQINVSDKGIGISKTNQQKIFDTFFRVHSGNIHDVKGYGIGLSYVKKIVEAHKGKIEVLSKLGFGTTFKIYLPYE